MRSNSLEIEATLAICAESPQLVARQIAGLTSIADYRLLPLESKTTHDLYVDTPDGALQRQKLALRVREIGESCWICLKGPSQPTDWGGVQRLEIESSWCEDALTRLVNELIDRGIKILPWREDFADVRPLRVMTSLGLEVIQDRSNSRETRNIVPMREQSSQVLAELAIDSVVYHFSHQEIRHQEVEVEAKVTDGSPVLKAVIESLVATYGRALRRWDHAKLATGMAIEKLLSEGALGELLDINNNLKPAAYATIHEYLKRGGG